MTTTGHHQERGQGPSATLKALSKASSVTFLLCDLKDPGQWQSPAQGSLFSFTFFDHMSRDDGRYPTVCVYHHVSRPFVLASGLQAVAIHHLQWNMRKRTCFSSNTLT